MAYLLSTEALLDYIAEYPGGATARWANTVPGNLINYSVISIAQAEIAINALKPDNPNRQPLSINLENVKRKAGTNHGLRVVDSAAAGRWAVIAPLTLSRSNGKTLGPDTRMVVATAMALDFTLVAKQDTWTDTLKAHGLRIVDPF